MNLTWWKSLKTHFRVMWLNYVVQVTHPIAESRSATVKYVKSNLVKFLISGSFANDTKITIAPNIDKLELIPLMAKVQSGMVALARPMNGDAVTVVMFTAGASVTYVADMMLRYSSIQLFMSPRIHPEHHYIYVRRNI